MTEGIRPSQSRNAQIENNFRNDDELSNLHDHKAQNVPHPDKPGGIPAELKNFLSQPIILRKQDPLKYWEEAKHGFPNAYRVAKKYLSIPATSVPFKRLFSRAGIIDSDYRRRLAPEPLSRLVFLHGVEEEEF